MDESRPHVPMIVLSASLYAGRADAEAQAAGPRQCAGDPRRWKCFILTLRA